MLKHRAGIPTLVVQHDVCKFKTECLLSLNPFWLAKAA